MQISIPGWILVVAGLTAVLIPATALAIRKLVRRSKEKQSKRDRYAIECKEYEYNLKCFYNDLLRHDAWRNLHQKLLEVTKDASRDRILYDFLKVLTGINDKNHFKISLQAAEYISSLWSDKKSEYVIRDMCAWEYIDSNLPKIPMPSEPVNPFLYSDYCY